MENLLEEERAGLNPQHPLTTGLEYSQIDSLRNYYVVGANSIILEANSIKCFQRYF